MVRRRRCVARAGVRKLVLYNSHGGNHALAEVVARRLRLDHGLLTVLAMNLAQGCMPGSPSAELFPGDEVRYGIHGGALETSLMLHLRPELVSIAAAMDFASRAAYPSRRRLSAKGRARLREGTGWLSRISKTLATAFGEGRSESPFPVRGELGACDDRTSRARVELWIVPTSTRSSGPTRCQPRSWGRRRDG